MRTIKVVIIGDSGVGKTSLRNQYVTGKFTTGYRATIGTDFITKTLPHYQNPDEPVTLQIWDTAGQERFSSLSAAFFRGADAAILMFDVNRPETLRALTKWWETFKAHAPVPDEEAEDFCCIVVGNKIDLVEEDNSHNAHNAQEPGRGNNESASEGGSKKRVSEADAESFLEELVPRKSVPNEAEDEEYESEGDQSSPNDPFLCNGNSDHSRLSTGRFMRRVASGFSLHSVTSSPSHPCPDPSAVPEADEYPGNRIKYGPDVNSPPRVRSQSISIQPSNGHARPFRRASPEVFSMLGGTMTTTHTTQTIYHTPSSSIFDQFESAPSSPFRDERNLPSTPPSSSFLNGAGPVTSYNNTRARRMTNASASSSSSAPTITPSLFLRTQLSSANSGSNSAALTPPTPVDGDSPTFSHAIPANGDATSSDYLRRKHRSRRSVPSRPERRPKLFLTSARTGEGVEPVFDHIARRVCMSWEYADALDALGLGRERDSPSTAASRGTRSDTLKLRLGLSNGSTDSRTVWLRDRFHMKGGASSCCGS